MAYTRAKPSERRAITLRVNTSENAKGIFYDSRPFDVSQGHAVIALAFCRTEKCSRKRVQKTWPPFRRRVRPIMRDRTWGADKTPPRPSSSLFRAVRMPLLLNRQWAFAAISGRLPDIQKPSPKRPCAAARERFLRRANGETASAHRHVAARPSGIFVDKMRAGASVAIFAPRSQTSQVGKAGTSLTCPAQTRSRLTLARIEGAEDVISLIGKPAGKKRPKLLRPRGADLCAETRPLERGDVWPESRRICRLKAFRGDMRFELILRRRTIRSGLLTKACRPRSQNALLATLRASSSRRPSPTQLGAACLLELPASIFQPTAMP